MWSHTVEVTSDTAKRIVVLSDGRPLPYGTALQRLSEQAAFRSFLTDLLARDAGNAFRWETPPLTCATLDRPFEFVLVNDPQLETRPQPAAFAAYFTGASAGATVLAVPNLGKTALLVVPRQMAAPAAYTHFARFLRQAPAEQVHDLWRSVAQTARLRLSPEPLWISTAGRGIAWLHVRIENDPKYYHYLPYRQGVAP